MKLSGIEAFKEIIKTESLKQLQERRQQYQIRLELIDRRLRELGQADEKPDLLAHLANMPEGTYSKNYRHGKDEE